MPLHPALDVPQGFAVPENEHAEIPPLRRSSGLFQHVRAGTAIPGAGNQYIFGT